MRTAEEINNAFSFHPATDKTGPMHDDVRSSVRDLALTWHATLPSCPETTLALRHLQQSMMFANAAIATHTPAPQ